MDKNKIKSIFFEQIKISDRVNTFFANVIRPLAFYSIFFLFILALSTTASGYDFDLWARLIVGKAVIQTGHVVMHDFLSYTPTHIWFDHEWGASVIFYIFQHFFSSFGILFLQSVLIFGMFYFVLKTVKLRGVKTTHPYNFLFYFFALSCMSYIIRSPIRCQLFSFLFFAVFLYLLERARMNVGKPLELYLTVPILMIVWNNLHGGCVSGIGLIALYLFGELLNKRPIKKYLIALVLSVLVLPINPWGFKYIPFLIHATTMQRKYVMEWWGIFFVFNLHKYLKFKIFMALMILLESVFAIKGIIAKKFNFDKTKFLVLLATLTLSIMHAKLIPLFVISASSFLYDDFYTAFNFITKNFFKKIAIFKDVFVYFVILIFITSNLNAKAFEPLVNPDEYPVLSVEFIKINNLKGNLLTNFGLGSYASYKLYPNNRIFMDGRYEEVYPEIYMLELKDFYLVQHNWDDLLNRFPPDVMIVEKYYPVYNALKLKSEWKLVYDKDTGFGVFVKSKDLKKHYKQPSIDMNYYKKTVFDTKINFVLQSNHE